MKWVRFCAIFFYFLFVCNKLVDCPQVSFCKRISTLILILTPWTWFGGRWFQVVLCQTIFQPFCVLKVFLERGETKSFHWIWWGQATKLHVSKRLLKITQIQRIISQVATDKFSIETLWWNSEKTHDFQIKIWRARHIFQISSWNFILSRDFWSKQTERVVIKIQRVQDIFSRKFWRKVIWLGRLYFLLADRKWRFQKYVS